MIIDMVAKRMTLEIDDYSNVVFDFGSGEKQGLVGAELKYAIQSFIKAQVDAANEPDTEPAPSPSAIPEGWELARRTEVYRVGEYLFTEREEAESFRGSELTTVSSHQVALFPDGTCSWGENLYRAVYTNADDARRDHILAKLSDDDKAQLRKTGDLR